MIIIGKTVIGARSLFASLAIAEEMADSVIALTTTLQAWGENPVLMAAVKAQNAKGMTLDQIKQRDSTWLGASGVDDFMQSLLESEAAKELTKLEGREPRPIWRRSRCSHHRRQYRRTGSPVNPCNLRETDHVLVS